MNLKEHIRTIPDFPLPGILFYDISTLLIHPLAWQEAINQMIGLIQPMRPQVLAGIESRGFILAAPLAARLGVSFVMIRKKGKLPGATVSYEYALEYGTDTLEVQEGMIQPQDRVVIIDDLLATGGTMSASYNLVQKVGGLVAGAACLIELSFLNGRQRLQDVKTECLLSYET